jgi:ribosomal protein L37AE/L43A
MQVDPQQEPIPKAVRPSQSLPTEAFNPLLRGLLGWGLIERVKLEDGSRHWELTDAAQRRLDELTPERQRAVTTLAYLDHSCSACRQQRLTHLVDGVYVCVECQRTESAVAESPLNGRAHERAWSRRSRRED